MATKTAKPVQTVNPTEAYLAADRSERAQMRQAWQTALDAAIKSSDLSAAQAVMTERDEAMAGVKTAKQSEPINYAHAIAERIAVLIDAAQALRTGTATPVGVDAADVDLSQVETYLTEFAQDDLSTERFSERAQALASERISRAGKRGDVGAFIVARLTALTTEPGQVFRVSELRAEAIDGYTPTSGAVSAALNAEREIEGVATVAASDAPSGALSATLV